MSTHLPSPVPCGLDFCADFTTVPLYQTVNYRSKYMYTPGN